MGLIYMYTSPSGKSYIGQTSRGLKQRAGDSFGHGYKGCEAFYRAIIKYGGLENFQIKIIEEVPNEQLNERERYYIKLFNTLSPQGYNLSPGGSQVCVHSKKVCKYDIKGNLLKIYPSLTIAAKENNCSITSISEVCHGRKITVKGFKWSFEGELPSKKIPKRKIVYCFDDEGYLLKEFEGTQNAAEYYQVPVWQVQQCANKARRKRVNNNLIFTYEPFVDWEYYKLKHKPQSSTTIHQE